MRSNSTSARLLAGLLLVQLAGFIAPFAMILPMLSADFLATAAAHGAQVRLAIAFLVLNGAVTVAISLLLRARLGAEADGMTLLLVLTSGALFTLQSVDNAHLLTMLSLSERAVAAGGGDDLLRAMGEVVRSTRRWVHYSTLFVIEAWMCILIATLLRTRMVPRALAFFGLLTVFAHFGGVVLPAVLGWPSVMALAPLMGVSEILVALWLVVRGSLPPRSAGLAG